MLILLEYMQLRYMYICSIRTFNSSIIYTAIPHSQIASVM